MVDVFISYPQRERDLMLPLKQRLEALGLILFVDVDGRLDGEATFPDALDKGVRASKAVLGVWSPWALTREWVKVECAIGKDENKLVAVERAALAAGEVPAQFYLVDRKPLVDFDGAGPHEGWAMTLSALATKLRLWCDARLNHPEAADVRAKITVLEKAAAAERAALGQAPTTAGGSIRIETPPRVVPAFEQAWSLIETSLEASHYGKFERAFEREPAAFTRLMEAEARAKALKRWAATDQTNPAAIAEALRSGLFPALQAVAERALAAAKARQVAKAKQLRTFTGHTETVQAVAVSPDGRLAISGSGDPGGNDFTVRLWDVATSGHLHTLAGHADIVVSVVFAPDGRTALSGSWDNTLKQWDVATGRELRTFAGHTGNVLSVAFAPDGKTALSSSTDNTLRLWNVPKGRESRAFTGHRSWVYSVAFSPDGRTALSGSHDKTLDLWNVATGQSMRTFNGHSDRVNSVAFAPDGKTALSGSSDQTVKLWDVATGRELRTFDGHTAWVTSVAFSPDGKCALSGSGDNTLKLWDVATGRKLRIFSGHTGKVISIAFSPDGREHTAGVTSVAFLPDGRTALSGSYDKTLMLWDVTP